MTRNARRAEPAIDILVQSPQWAAEPKAEATVRDAIAAASSFSKRGDFEVSILLTNDGAVRALNKQWRRIDSPTNVLSFPATQARGAGMPEMLGDIVIAYETVAKEAAAEHKTFLHHLAHLTVHGFLHLIGYDHENDADAEAMERQERVVLKKLGVSDPYSHA